MSFIDMCIEYIDNWSYRIYMYIEEYILDDMFIKQLIKEF